MHIHTHPDTIATNPTLQAVVRNCETSLQAISIILCICSHNYYVQRNESEVTDIVQRKR